MEITKYLRLDRVNKKGLAPIYYTIHFDNIRMRMSTEQRVIPSYWEPDKSSVKSQQKGYLEIRSRLNELDKIIGDVYEDFKRRGIRPTLEQFEWEVKRLYFKLPDLEPVPEPEPEPTYFDLYNEFIKHHRRTISPYTGKPITESTITSYQNTFNRLQDYIAFRAEEGEVIELSLAGMDKHFYNDFRDYIMLELDQEVDTFSKHIRRIKTFLKWCDEEKELTVNRKYKQFDTPTSDATIEPLTEAELNTISSLRFDQPDIQVFVLETFLKEKSSSGSDAHKVRQRIETLEKIRDCFLFMCYTGMRVSDAFQFTPANIHGDLIVFTAQKTNEECLVPLYDDGLFKPLSIIKKYQGQQPTCLPVNKHINKYLKYIQQLAGITRLNLTTKIGRKTFVTLKIYQGVPSRLIMQATGHQTEAAFNAYAGVDRKRLVEEFKNKSGSQQSA